MCRAVGAEHARHEEPAGRVLRQGGDEERAVAPVDGVSVARLPGNRQLVGTGN